VTVLLYLLAVAWTFAAVRRVVRAAQAEDALARRVEVWLAVLAGGAATTVLPALPAGVRIAGGAAAVVALIGALDAARRRAVEERSRDDAIEDVFQ
jgi:hypothetical protein